MKTRKQPYIRQHCSACILFVKPSLEYPNYACSKCVAQAVNEKGEKIIFSLSSEVIQATLADDNKLVQLTTCLIKGMLFQPHLSQDSTIVLLPASEIKPKRKRKGLKSELAQA